MSDDEAEPAPRLTREEEEAQRKERAKQELEEYENQRKEEREKAEEEIRMLRERREQRKKEREEEEKKMAEHRAVEEQRRKAEEEERQRKKREEESKRRDDREAKMQEMAKKHQSSNKPNFVITKRSGDGGQEEDPGPVKEVKSKEQIEAERKAILNQRIQPLSINGFSGDQLREKAKELFDQIYKLESEKYDLEQTFKQQAYDMADLAERARQMNKGGKGSKATTQAEPDPLATKLGGIPPKLVMYSQYERVKDHRTFGDRQTLYQGPMYGEEYVRIEPQHKVGFGEAGFEVVGPYEPDAPKSAAEPQPPAPKPEPEASEEITVEE